MSKLILHIAIFTLVVSSCAGSKKVLSSSKDDVVAPDPVYISAFHEGIRLKLKGRNDEAVLKFEECLSISQTDPAVYYAIAQIATKKNDFQTAQLNLEKAHQLDESNHWYVYELAQLALGNEDYSTAIVYLNELVDIENRNTEWQFMLAEAYIRNNQVQNGIDVYDRVEEITGLIPGLSIQKFQLYQSISKSEEALAELEKAESTFPRDESILGAYVDYYYRIGDVSKATEYVEKLIAVNPENGQAQLSYAEILLGNGKKKEALEALESVFKDKKIDENTKVEIVLMIKERYASWKAAQLTLSKLLVETYPENSRANSLYADEFIEKDDYLNALPFYKKSLKIDPSEFAVWNQVVLIEYQLKRFDDLYNDTKACLELYPTNISIYLLNGIACNELGKYEEAIEILETGLVYVVEQNPVADEIYGELGMAYYAVGSFRKGDDMYEKGIANSNSNLLRYSYAVSLIKSNRNLEKAARFLADIRSNSPNNVSYLLLETRLRILNKEYEEAKVVLEQFLLTNPDSESNAEFCELFGDVYFLTKNNEKARFYWGLASQSGGDKELLLKKINGEEWYVE